MSTKTKISSESKISAENKNSEDNKISESKKFCRLCNNLLKINTNNDTLMFICYSCNEHYPSNEYDTLRYEMKKNNVILNLVKLRNIERDPVNIKTFKKCPKCSHNIAKQSRLENLRIIYACIADGCGHKWVE